VLKFSPRNHYGELSDKPLVELLERLELLLVDKLEAGWKFKVGTLHLCHME
jgi:hypothetical protein